MRDGEASKLTEETEATEFARLQQWDAEIEAEFRRKVTATKAAGRKETRATAGRLSIRISSRRVSVDRGSSDLGRGRAHLSTHARLQQLYGDIAGRRADRAGGYATTKIQ